jgi:hypothetical protein
MARIACDAGATLGLLAGKRVASVDTLAARLEAFLSSVTSAWVKASTTA